MSFVYVTVLDRHMTLMIHMRQSAQVHLLCLPHQCAQIKSIHA